MGFFCQILSDFVRCESALQKKDIVAAQAKENQIRKSVSVNLPEQKPVDTREEIAKQAGVSHGTEALN